MTGDGERRPGDNGAALENTNIISEHNNYKERDQSLQGFRNIVVGYIRRGLAPVPIPARAKAPKITGWPTLRIKEADVPRYFDRVCNIGVLLGEASDGLTDGDLDCPEAIALAPKVLPATAAVFGRATRPRSHYLYRIDGKAPTIKFLDPITGTSLLELRGDGGLQTVFPPSIHPSGELIEWAEEGEPATVEREALVKAAKRLAAFCLIRRYLHPGSETSDAGGGIPFMITQAQKAQLLERGYTPEQISDMTPIEAQKRPAVRDYESLLSALKQCDSRVASRIRDWLGLGRSSDPPDPDNDDLLKGSIPSHVPVNDNCRFTDRLAAVLPKGLNERPTFWSEPIAEECAQMCELRDNAANQGRDSWWLCLGVLAYCEDGDQFAHPWGSPHPKYSAEETQRELDGWRRKADGATLCDTFDRKSPGICGECPHRGAIRSPISLGMRCPAPTLAPDAPWGTSLPPCLPEIETQSAGMSPSPLGIETRSESIGIIRGDELLATTAPPRRWLAEKFVPAAETTNLAGDGGAGKTTLALQLSVACVSGGKWIGLNVKQCNHRTRLPFRQPRISMS